MPINVFRQSRCLNTSDSICDLFKWVCDRNDRNDKGNGKSYMRRSWQRFIDQLSFLSFVSLFGRQRIFEGYVLVASAKHATQKARRAMRDLSA